MLSAEFSVYDVPCDGAPSVLTEWVESGALSLICPCQAVAEFHIRHSQALDTLDDFLPDGSGTRKMRVYLITDLVDLYRGTITKIDEAASLGIRPDGNNAIMYASSEPSPNDPRLREIAYVLEALVAIGGDQVLAELKERHVAKELRITIDTAFRTLTALGWISSRYLEPNCPIISKMLLLSQALGGRDRDGWMDPRRIVPYLKEPVRFLSIAAANGADGPDVVRDEFRNQIAVALRRIAEEAEAERLEGRSGGAATG